MMRFFFTSLATVSLALYLVVVGAWIASNVKGVTVSADYRSTLLVILSSNGQLELFRAPLPQTVYWNRFEVSSPLRDFITVDTARWRFMGCLLNA